MQKKKGANVNIQKMMIKYNKTPARGRKIKYIVIHDTGNTGKGAGVDSHYNYFNGGNRNASADFFVDDKKVGQFTDYRNEYSWHAGKRYGNPPVKDCTNSNSIGIEICINPDSNYGKAVDSTVEVVKYLQKELNIPTANVIRHYDACLKQCPGSMAKNNWQAWKEFKQKLEAGNTLPEQIKEAFKFDDNTINYIQSYKHADALMQAFIDKRPISPATEEYVLGYKFGRAILSRVYG